MPVKDIDILKAIILKEAETENLPQGFEDDPMGFIVKKYPGLHEVLIYLMTESFRDYVDAIFVVAPKPTTFKIVLHNGQFYFLQFMGKTYQATVSGKNYYLMSIGEKERCMLAIARILRYGNPLKTKGPEGAEQGTRPAGEEAGGETGAEVPEATPEAGGEKAPVTESMILEAILKKTLNEDADSESGDDTKKYEIAATKKLNAQIQSIVEPLTDDKKSITIVVNGEEYPDIVRAEVVPGSQNKSDIDLINSKDEHVIFISHKDVGGSKRFARWGSFQYLYNENNSEVDNFKKNIYSFVKNKSEKNYTNEKEAAKARGYAKIENDGKLVFSKKASFSQKIASDDLKKKLVFGENFGGNPGLNNVQLVIQGDIVLKKSEEKPGVYEFDLTKSEKAWINGDLPSGEYEPVLHVHYRGESKSRGAVHNELGIENCETMSKPISSISGPDETRSLWAANEVLDPNIEIPKRKVEIDKEDSLSLKSGGRAASEDWINKNKKYKQYFNLNATPIKFSGKKGVFYTLNPDAEIELVKKED